MTSRISEGSEAEAGPPGRCQSRLWCP